MAAQKACLRAEFDAKTGYERMALGIVRDARALFHGRDKRTIIDDIRPTSREYRRVLDFPPECSDGADALVAQLRPLLFGAAYKIVDQAVEFVMELNGQPKSKNGDWRMETKKKYCDCAPSPAAQPKLPAPLDMGVWTRIATLYARLLDERHSLSHRRVRVLPDGSLQGTDRGGKPLKPIPAEEVEHFAVFAYMLGETIASGEVRMRQRNALRWGLDQLATLHGESRTGAVEAHPEYRVVKDNLEQVDPGRWAIDVGRILQHLSNQNAPEIADLELHTDEDTDRIFRARVEELPERNRVEFDEVALPGWIAFDVGPSVGTT